MPTFDIQAPDGQTYEVDGPDANGALDALHRTLSAQQVHPANGGFGTRAQREPEMIDTGRGGVNTPTIPYAEGLAHQYHEMDNPQDPVNAALKGTALGDVVGGGGAFGNAMGPGMIPGLEKGIAGLGAALGTSGSGGGTYEDRLAYQRGQDDLSSALHPVASTAGTATGTLAAGAALPGTNIGRLGTVGNMAATGALYGGAGAGIENNGTLGDKIAAAAKGFGIGAGIGGALGGVGKAVGGVLGLGGKVVAPTAESAGQDAVRAGAAEGLTIPQAAATDSTALRGLSAGAAGTWAGAPLRNAVVQSTQDLGKAIQERAATIGTPQSAEVLGGNLERGIGNYTGKVVPENVKSAYDVSFNQLPDDVTAPLSATKAAQQEAMKTAERLGIQPPSAATYLKNAVTKELSAADAKALRTAYGNQMEDAFQGQVGGKSAPAKQFWGTLTDDLGNTVQSAGGPQAVADWRTANRYSRMLSGRSEALNTLLGNNDASTFTKLSSLTQVGSKENSRLLMQARAAIPKQDWGDFGATLMNNMGQGPKGFSPAKFLTEYGKMSEPAKNIIFSAEHRASLDNFAKVANSLERVSKMGNPSGTGNVISTLAAGAGVLHPITLLGTALPPYALAKIMAKPAGVRGMSNFSEAYSRFANSANAATARTLTTATKAFSLVVAKELGDTAKARDIEQHLLNVPATQGAPQ